nr:transposase [Pararhodonellum marinum]
MQDIKGDSSKWINQKGFVRGKFSWQDGYGAFSYSKSHVDKVIDYIKNQETKHRKKSFLEEYREFLEKFEVTYEERYLFKEIQYDRER